MSNSIVTKNFRVQAGEKVDLGSRPTTVKPLFKSKKQYHHMLDSQVEELSALQRLHYSSDRYAMLLIFQGMDAAGKDGALRHVMSGVNPLRERRRRRSASPSRAGRLCCNNPTAARRGQAWPGYFAVASRTVCHSPLPSGQNIRERGSSPV